MADCVQARFLEVRLGVPRTARRLQALGAASCGRGEHMHSGELPGDDDGNEGVEEGVGRVAGALPTGQVPRGEPPIVEEQVGDVDGVANGRVHECGRHGGGSGGAGGSRAGERTEKSCG